MIKSRAQVDTEALAFARRLDHGESVKPRSGIYFESLEAVRTFLTEIDAD